MMSSLFQERYRREMASCQNLYLLLVIFIIAIHFIKNIETVHLNVFIQLFLTLVAFGDFRNYLPLKEIIL